MAWSVIGGIVAALYVMQLVGFVVFVIARIVSIPVTECAILGGPKLFKKKVGMTEFQLGVLPIGGFVRYDEEGYCRAGILRQSLLILGSCGALFAIAVICRGFTVAMTSTLNGFVQVLAPFFMGEAACDLLSNGAAYLASVPPFTAIVGIVAAKMCAMNLIPVGGSNSWYFLKGLLATATGDPNREFRALNQIGLFSLLALIIGWICVIVFMLQGKG